MRVLELPGDADLAQESLGAEDGRKLGVEHLERDQAVVLEVAGEVHRGHPAAAELALDRVTARERSSKALEQTSILTAHARAPPPRCRSADRRG